MVPKCCKIKQERKTTNQQTKTMLKKEDCKSFADILHNTCRCFPLWTKQPTQESEGCSPNQQPFFNSQSLSLSLSSNNRGSFSLMSPVRMACSMTPRWQKTYWSGIWILKARWLRMRRTVAGMSTVLMSSRRRRLMSMVMKVPAEIAMCLI